MTTESPTIEQHVSAAIVAAQGVYAEPLWNKWALEWLNGVDRSVATAEVELGRVTLVAAVLPTTSPEAAAATAARTAAHVAIGLGKAQELRAAGHNDLADTLDKSTAAMAEAACRVSLHG